MRGKIRAVFSASVIERKKKPQKKVYYVWHFSFIDETIHQLQELRCLYHETTKADGEMRRTSKIIKTRLYCDDVEKVDGEAK